MPKSTFDTYKSVNDRLHNKLSQADEYQKFLKRIQSIVDRKKRIDRSSDFYMTFLNKSRETSKKQKSLQRQYSIQLQNKNLLQRIQKEKTRKMQENSVVHEVHMEERRAREMGKISEENGRMAQRIMNQDSYLANKKIIPIEFNRASTDSSAITKQREEGLKFYDSRIKNRKLPKLIKSPSVSNVSSHVR